MEDRIAREFHNIFKSLPKKSKPIPSDGVNWWVPLSGIAVVGEDETVTCLSLGTGMKCLPASKLPTANGRILHDWHAEVLAVRAFNRALLDECADLIAGRKQGSSLVRRLNESEMASKQQSQPFSIRDGLKIAMYCSEAPCGDASMELVMEAQEDATPWPVSEDSTLLGRGSFSQLGVVRRKPARGDSPLASSKSCSDKIALKQCTSLLSAHLSLLVSPENAYLHSLIIPSQQYRKEACVRAFGEAGRMRAMAGIDWKGGYIFRPLEVLTAEVDFEFSRRRAQELGRAKGLNVAAVWTSSRQETLINGVLAGRKQDDPAGASMLSRHAVWTTIVEIASQIDSDFIKPLKVLESYQQFKKSGIFEDRLEVLRAAREQALQKWAPNTEDDFSAIAHQ